MRRRKVCQEEGQAGSAVPSQESLCHPSQGTETNRSPHANPEPGADACPCPGRLREGLCSALRVRSWRQSLCGDSTTAANAGNASVCW